MNFFRQMRECVIDFKFYKEIRDNRFSKSFTYLLLLYLIIYFIGGTKIYVVTKAVVQDLVVQVSSNLPDFKLENGEFSFSGRMPHYISSSTNEVFVIDTTGQTDEKVLEGVRSGMLITKDKLYVKQNAGELRIISLKEFNQVVITKAKIIEFLPKLSWIVLIMMVFGFVFALGWKLLNAVILALVGLAINASMNASLKYNDLLNISIYALTLPLLLQLAVNLSDYLVPGFTFIYWAISIVYVAMAVRSIKNGNAEGTPDSRDDLLGN